MRGLPSAEVPESEKSSFTEADVHSKLLETDLAKLGFPPRSNRQSAGEYSVEQQRLAVFRLKSHEARRGHFDILYLIGNSPVVLVEVKRYDVLDKDKDFERAKQQLMEYALSADFEVPPPFLILYSGKDATTIAFRRTAVDATDSTTGLYEELDRLWTWDQIKNHELRGSFAVEEVTADRLLEILIHHLDRLEDDLRPQIIHAADVVKHDGKGIPLTEFGEFLANQPEVLQRMRNFLDRKRAEVGKDKYDDAVLIDEVVTQAAMNYLNKVFFLNLCEERRVRGFYRILREFLPETKSRTTRETAAVFMGMLRKRIKDTKSELWTDEEDRTYRKLREDLTGDIREHVIDQNNWWELIRVAFDLAEETFPLIYREDALDDFKPASHVVAEMIYDLSTKSYVKLTNHNVGDIYQGLLASRRAGSDGKGGRQRQRSRLGAFYTPKAHVDYMVRQLGLTKDSKVLDPCMGSGHFLEGIYEVLLDQYRSQGFNDSDAHKRIVDEQIYGADIDTFATALSAIRMFLLDEHDTGATPRLFVHDMLLHSPERPAGNLFDPAAAAGLSETAQMAVVDHEVDELGAIDEIAFDAVVGNPPYGARKPKYKEAIYARLYGAQNKSIAAGSAGTGDGDTYSMFFVNAIERLKEGGRLCLITSDSFRSLTSHRMLRRHILDHCKIIEILVTDTKRFEGVSFQYAGMAITTLEKCSDAEARAKHEMRLVDYVADPDEFALPPSERILNVPQSRYAEIDETPFYVGVPDEIVQSIASSLVVNDVATGRQGLITADDKEFLAGIDEPFTGLPMVIESSQLASSLTADEMSGGISDRSETWVRFAKGEGFGEYWGLPTVAIDWSADSVDELKRRDRFKSGTPRKPRFQNRDFYFKSGLTYSVVSSGRISFRQLPPGCVFSDKGSAFFTQDDASESFLLGYLNSSLATYFLKRIFNTTATAHIGYIEKLPYRKPPAKLEKRVIGLVEEIIELLKTDPESDISKQRDEIDDLIFDLFEIKSSRQIVRDFYESL